MGNNTQRHTVTQHAGGRCTIQCGQCQHQGKVPAHKLHASSTVRCTQCGQTTPTEDLTGKLRMIRQPGVSFATQ